MLQTSPYVTGCIAFLKHNALPIILNLLTITIILSYTLVCSLILNTDSPNYNIIVIILFICTILLAFIFTVASLYLFSQRLNNFSVLQSISSPMTTSSSSSRNVHHFNNDNDDDLNQSLDNNNDEDK